jgi:uncharacterized protein involved in exopolysaccharide biosynthesis/Mrp family chromosome partitioning ATPase
LEKSIINRGRLSVPQQSTANDHDADASDWRLPLANDTAITPFWQLMMTLWHSKWFILSLAIIGGLLAGIFGLSRPVLYEAKTQLIISAPNLDAATGTATISQDAANGIVDDHLTMLVSPAQLRRTIGALSTKDNMSALAALRKEGEAAGALSTIAATISSWMGKIRQLLNPEQSSMQAASEDADLAPLEALSNGIRVGQELRSRVIRVGFTDNDPAIAKVVANTFVQAYVDHLTEQSRASYQRDLTALTASIPEMQRELARAIEEKETYLMTKSVEDQAGAGTTAKEISQLRQLLSVAKANLAAAKNRSDNATELRRLSSAETGEPAMRDGGKTVTGDGGGLRLSTAQNNQHEVYQPDQEVQIFQTQIASLEERVVALEAMATDAVISLSGLRALELQLDAASKRYSELLAKRETLRQHVKAPTPGISILSVAWLPTDPRTMSAIFLVPPGMIFFGLLAGIIAVLRHSFDDTLRGDADSEEVLGIPSAGMLPKLNHPTAKYLHDLLLDRPKSTYGRAVSSILLSIVSDLAGAKSPQLLLVTSSTRRDCKTELAWSLALSAKRFGRRALFIDLDTQEDPLTRLFRNDFGSGTATINFADFAEGRCPLEKAVQSMPEIGVDLMHSTADLTDLLGRLPAADISRSIKELREQYSLVIMNGPTGIEGPEVGLLAFWADTVLFAVRWGATRRHMARAALKQVSRGVTHPAIVKSVLTDVNPKQEKRFRFGDSGDLLRTRPKAIAVDLPAMRWPPSRQSKGLPIA